MGKEEQWFTAYDEATGDPYYYTASGAVSWDRPASGSLLRSRGASVESNDSIENLKAKSVPMKPAKPQRERKLSSIGAALRGNPPTKKNSPAKPPKPVKLHCIYAFKASKPGELTLKKGTVVTGIRLETGNEWWYGHNKKGTYGIFPCAFVEPIKEGPSVPKPPLEKPPKPASMRSFRSVSSKKNVNSSTTNLKGSKPNLAATPSFKTVAATAKQSYIKQMPLQYALYAHNLGYASAFFLMFLGIATLEWSIMLNGNPREDQLLLVNVPGFLPYYCICLSVLVFLGEYFMGLKRTATVKFPVRGALYMAVAAPTFFSFGTILVGICLVSTSIANFKAYRNSEHGEVKGMQYLPKMNISSWPRPQLLLVVVIVGCNAVLWVHALFRWIGIVKSLPGCDPNVSPLCPSDFAPFAKAFGQTLNLNCALILFPILKTLVAKAAQNGGVARNLDIGKSLELHKLFAWLIGVGTLGHFFFHMLNYSARPRATLDRFGYLAFITGAVVFLTMVLMYAGAQRRVKHANFEIFWFSHHLFVVFFGMLLAHGPEFYKWGALSLVLYVGEVILRRGRANRNFLLRSVHWSPPVMCLRFFPEQKNGFAFKEGQYLRLMIPHVSKNEWHPFTMSSAFGDLEKEGSVSLHIRVMEPGSWTHRAKEYFCLLAGSGKTGGYFLDLKHFNNHGSPEPGKYLGPDGLPLVVVDGPHPAPAQHFEEYDEVMLIGAGIGMTPCAAIIQSVLKYKWKKGFNPQTIRFYWILKHAEIESFRWFIKLLTRLQRQVIADRLANALTGHHELEINVYVTSAPKNKRTTNLARGSITETGDQSASRGAIEAGYDVDIGFSDRTLTLALMNTAVPAEQQAELQARAMLSSNEDAPGNKLKDIWVWNGRPQWDSIFEAVTARTNSQGTRKDVGVVFCGTPVIGSALKVLCKKHSVQDSITYSLHKEKF